MRRVVITGLGIVSCLGNNQEEVHQSLLNSKSGISYAEEYTLAAQIFTSRPSQTSTKNI